jgi:hypothetical protein
VIAISALVVGAPFLPDRSAQILAGVLTTVVTTFVGVYATYHSASASSRRIFNEELTRYGLLAWRNVDSLEIKLQAALQQPGPTLARDSVKEWLLDIDQAKWAWQDILREVFDLQQRLQAETYELAQEYREKIRSTQDPFERHRLAVEQQVKLVSLASSSPLPIRVPIDVRCPNCGADTAVSVGPNSGDSDTTRCSACRRLFHAHRASDGRLFTRQSGPSYAERVDRSERHAEENSDDAIEQTEVNRLVWLEAVRDTFASVQDEILRDGFDELIDSVRRKLVAQGHPGDDAFKAKNWLFSLKAFKLLGKENGIGLVVPAVGLIDFVEEAFLLQCGPNGRPSTAEEFASQLYGFKATRLKELAAILARAQSPE